MKTVPNDPIDPTDERAVRTADAPRNGRGRRPRPTVLDNAIANLDAKVANLRDEIKALELARQHLVEARARVGDRV